MRYQNPPSPAWPWRTPFASRMGRPSERRDRVYQAILDYAADHGGQSPTIREIQEMTGISSTSVVNYHIHNLVELGKLEIRDRKLIVVGATWTPPECDSGMSRTDRQGDPRE